MTEDCPGGLRIKLKETKEGKQNNLIPLKNEMMNVLIFLHKCLSSYLVYCS